MVAAAGSAVRFGIADRGGGHLRYRRRCRRAGGEFVQRFYDGSACLSDASAAAHRGACRLDGCAWSGAPSQRLERHRKPGANHAARRPRGFRAGWFGDEQFLDRADGGFYPAGGVEFSGQAARRVWGRTRGIRKIR